MSLKLPKNLQVYRSAKKEKEILQRLRDVVEGFERRIESPIHISDILEPRKAYWQRVSPKKFDDDTILYFSLGYAGHEYLLHQKDEGSKTEGDLTWSPDAIETVTIPIEEGGPHAHDYKKKVAITEVKITTKRKVATTKKDLKKYLEQLVSYMAMEKLERGYLVIWYVAPNGPPQIVVFTTQATKQALGRFRKQILDKTVELRTALVAMDHTPLELCRKDLCYRSKCQWYDECKPEGRYKEKREETGE